MSNSVKFIRCVFQSTPPSVSDLPPSPEPLNEASLLADKEVHPPASPPSSARSPRFAPSPASAPCSKLPSPNFDAVHRLIKLHCQESRHHRFLLRAWHKQALRSQRSRSKSKQTLLSKFGSFLFRGSKTITNAIRKFIAKVSINIATAATQFFDSATAIIDRSLGRLSHWRPPWLSTLFPTTTLYCNSNFFVFNNSDVDPGPVRFDTDSIPVGADVCASATVCPHKHMFTDLEPVDGMTLKGVGGRIHVAAKGTLHLTFEDDKGETQCFQIADSYYVPDLKMTLLCPQQWAKQREQEFGMDDGAQFVTKGNYARFEWDKAYHTITVPMDATSNLPILNTIPTYHRSADLIANAATTESKPIACTTTLRLYLLTLRCLQLSLMMRIRATKKKKHQKMRPSKPLTSQLLAFHSSPPLPRKPWFLTLFFPRTKKPSFAFTNAWDISPSTSCNKWHSAVSSQPSSRAVGSPFAQVANMENKPSDHGVPRMLHQVQLAASPSRLQATASRWINSSPQPLVWSDKSRVGSRKSDSISRPSSWTISLT